MKRVGSILIALTVLFVTTGFTVSKHFCGSKLKAVSYILKVEECNHGNAIEVKSCHKQNSIKKHCSKNTAIKKDDCCKTTFENHQLDTDYTFAAEKVEINKQQVEFITAFVFTLASNINSETYSKKYTEYQPPKIYRDIPVLIQSFLI